GVKLQWYGGTASFLDVLRQVPQCSMHRIPQFGLLTRNAERWGYFNFGIVLVGYKIDIAIGEGAVDEYDRITFFQCHVRDHPGLIEGLLHRKTIEHQPFAVCKLRLLLAVYTGPQLIRDFTDGLVGVPIVRQAGRPCWPRAEDDATSINKLLDVTPQFRADRRPVGQHQYPVRQAIGQGESAVFHGQPIQYNFCIDVVERIPFRQGWVLYTGHLGSILADEISHIGYITALLEHV